MFRNYFVVAVRNMLKYKFFTAINMIGMTVGIASCLLLMLYVSNELTYDNFHPDADRLYQVDLHGKVGGQDIRVASTCPPMAAALVSDMPEVESAMRIASMGDPVFRSGDKMFSESKIFYVDSNFFRFFGYRLLQGDAATALNEPNSIVLDEKLAEKYFGTEDPVGKIIQIGGEKKSFKVTGVVEQAPANSHFDYHALASASSAEQLKSTIWLNNFMYTYFKLKPNASIAGVQEKFIGMVEKYVGPELEKFMGTTLKQMKEAGGAFGYYTTPVRDIHLHSTSQGDLEPGGSMMYVYFFGGIGIFILLIACINFMNLATARSAGRAKEVGMRKALGSHRSQMIGQFLSESVLYSLMAVVLAMAATYFLLPYFNVLSGKELTIAFLGEPLVLVGIAGLVVVVGLVAGSYPAFYLTSFSSVEVLKGKVRSGLKSKGIRSFLVVFQFALSIFLIIFTAVVFQQLNYMQEKNLGIDKNNILILDNAYRLDKNREAFRNAINQETGVVKASYTNNSFPGINNTTAVKGVGNDQDHILGVYYADYDHQDVMKFEIKLGRYFSRDFPSDSTGILLNEAAAKEFGWENPLGEEVLYNDGTPRKLKVIGVFKNFNFESFKDQVRPISIILTKNSNTLLIRYDGKSTDIVATAERLWKQYAPNEPFEYSFMDQNFDRLFRSEQRMGQLFSVFSGLAILIACLGLFALAAFTAEQRTKEMGIRKSLGASTVSLNLLMSGEFIRLVIIAFVPAALLGWYVSDTWLTGFVYRIEISPLVFVLSGLTAVVIAWLTVSVQSLKAAAANPVKSLRYE